MWRPLISDNVVYILGRSCILCSRAFKRIHGSQRGRIWRGVDRHPNARGDPAGVNRGLDSERIHYTYFAATGGPRVATNRLAPVHRNFFILDIRCRIRIILYEAA